MKDIQLLEQALIKYGSVVSHKHLSSLLYGYSNINNKINSLVKKGRLVNLKRGTYYITKIGTSGYATISNYLTANLIGEESFVSFEAALQFHGFFDQGVKKYRSISRKQYLGKRLEGTEYKYINVNEKSFFGFDNKAVDGGIAAIALKERALLDLLEYERTTVSVSIALEILQNYYDDFDHELLIKYLENFSKVTAKTLGLFYDWLGKDSTKIKKLLAEDKAVSRLTKMSGTYSKKWRLYYDSILENQL